MSIIHRAKFSAEAGPLLKRAADAAVKKDGILGYHILSPDFETFTLILVADNKQALEALKGCEASQELWESHPPLLNEWH